MKIAVIGVGMVGSAVVAGSQACEEICTYDKFREDRTKNWEHAWRTQLCFVCVPTPTNDGRQDLSAVMDALRLLRGLSTEGYQGVVAIKSTVLPGTMRYLQDQFPELRLVHNPEFLCERTAVHDYIGQRTILISGKAEDIRVVRVYADKCLRVRDAHYSQMFECTEWAKYVHNCMLPVQLSFLNEVYDLIGDQWIYDEAVSMAQWFGNVGPRSRVPGPDGQRGWGGACFPKDTKALETFALSRGLRMHTLSGAINTNLNVRHKETENERLPG
jgi:UDPglucose 6-dehydrogenase